MLVSRKDAGTYWAMTNGRACHIKEIIQGNGGRLKVVSATLIDGNESIFFNLLGDAGYNEPKLHRKINKDENPEYFL